MRITILLLLLLIISGFTPAETEGYLNWSEARPLTWDDFRAAPDQQAFGSALTAVKISAKPYREKGKLQYSIKASFLRDHSWCKTKSQGLLNHEQGHFDIAEVYARKARIKVRQLQQSGVTDYRIYNSEIRKLLNESNAADMRYDRETLNGALLKQQIAWDLAIQRLLKEMNGFR